MKGLLYILVFVFALDAQAGILFRRRGGGIFSGARRSGGMIRRRVGCIPGQCAQSGFYRNQGSRPIRRNPGGCNGGGCGNSLPQSMEGGSDFGNSGGGHDLGGAQPQPSFAQPGASDRPVAEPAPAADPEPSLDFDSAPASSTIKATDDDLAVPAPALQLSGTKGSLAAGTPAPAKESKKNANDTLKKYFEQKKEETNKKAEEWKSKILAALDKDSLKTVIEELLIEDQMFLEPEEEKSAFGKPLKEFSPQERKDLVTKYTQLQKELRDKLLTEVAEALKKNRNPKSLSVAESLIQIKKDHLDAYDRVIREIKNGTIDTETTFCFTCDESRTIGSEHEGYTFGGAMEEAAKEAVRLSQAPAGAQPSVSSSDKDSASTAPDKTAVSAPEPKAQHQGALGNIASYLSSISGKPTASQYPRPENMATALGLVTNDKNGYSYLEYKGPGQHYVTKEYGVKIRWDLIQNAPQEEKRRVFKILSDVIAHREPRPFKVDKGQDGYCLWCNLKNDSTSRHNMSRLAQELR